MESEPPNVSKIQGHEIACSSGVIDTSSNTIEGPVLTRSSSSDTTSDEKINLTLGYRVHFGEQILERMMNSIMHENSYLHYFKELLRLEEVLRMDVNAGEEFKIIEFSQMSYVKMGQSKSLRSKQVQRSFLYDSKHNKCHNTSKNRQHEKIENKEKFAVSQTKRIDLRRKILKKPKRVLLTKF